MTDKGRVIQWIKAEEKKGLLDIDFTLNPARTSVTEDEIWAELWRLISAPDMPDKEVLGSYSPIYEEKKKPTGEENKPEADGQGL